MTIAKLGRNLLRKMLYTLNFHSVRLKHENCKSVILTAIFSSVTQTRTQLTRVWLEYESSGITCADPEGGTGGPDPPWNLKILPKKGNFGIF